MKKLLSIVLVIVVAMGTMVFAFADTGLEESAAEETTAVVCPYGQLEGQRIMNRYASAENGIECQGDMVQARTQNGAQNKAQNMAKDGEENRLQTSTKEMNGQGLRNGNGAGNSENQGNGLRDGSGIEEGRGRGNGHFGAEDGTGRGDRLRAGTEDCVNAE